MPRKKNTETEVSPTVETPTKEIVSSVSKEEESEKYVVVRDDRRVSDNEYKSPDDPKAVEEHNFWYRVVSKWSRGEKVETVKFNKKKHRNW